MKVIITKVDSEYKWYSDKIGKVFEARCSKWPNVWELVPHSHYKIPGHSCEELPNFDLDKCIVVDIKDEETFIKVSELSGKEWNEGYSPKKVFGVCCYKDIGINISLKRLMWSNKEYYVKNEREDPIYKNIISAGKYIKIKEAMLVKTKRDFKEAVESPITSKITEFESGKWYRYTGPDCFDSVSTFQFNDEGEMDFMLDGKPHQCNEADDEEKASFHDSPDSTRRWDWRGIMDYIEECDSPELDRGITPWTPSTLEDIDRSLQRSLEESLKSQAGLWDCRKMAELVGYHPQYSPSAFFICSFSPIGVSIGTQRRRKRRKKIRLNQEF